MSNQAYSYNVNVLKNSVVWLAILSLVALFIFPVLAKANYWGYSQAANSYCDNNGQVAIWIRFTNSDSHATGGSLVVTATDEQSGVSHNYGAIVSKDTQDSVLYTSIYSNANGRVRFDVVFPDLSTETDYATYSGKVCGVAPTASPSLTPSSTSSPTPSPTPTNTPTVGNSPVASASSTSAQSSSGPSASNTPNGDGFGCLVRDCSGNEVGRGGAVLGLENAKVLPNTSSASYNVLGVASVILSIGYLVKLVSSK
ncbi:MAG: hypothetical protein M3P33_02605 [bacterium]|nr:hypothetical protein [bacterium]